jgi:hypothetical protein
MGFKALGLAKRRREPTVQERSRTLRRRRRRKRKRGRRGWSPRRALPLPAECSLGSEGDLIDRSKWLRAVCALP